MVLDYLVPIITIFGIKGTLMARTTAECTKLLEDEFRSHFNEPVISGDRIMRCVGFGEDDSDFYVLLKDMNGRIIWHTAVGGYTFLNRLKGQNYVMGQKDGKDWEEWDDFKRLDNFLELNGAKKEDEFLRYESDHHW